MKKFIGDVFFNATYQILLIILPFITIPILSRRLSPDGLGVYSYVFSIAQFLMLIIATGINPFRIRKIVQNRADKNQMSQTFWTLFTMQAILGAVVIGLYTVIIFSLDLPHKNLYLIQILFLIGTALDIAWFYQGIEEFVKVVIRNVVIKGLSVFFIIAFVKTDQDIPTYLLITSLSTLLGSGIFWIELFKYVKLPKISTSQLKTYWKPAFIILLPQIFMQIYTTLDKFIIGSLTSSAELTYYDQSQKIVRILLALLSSVSVVMLPKLSQAAANGEKSKVFIYTKKSIHYTLVLSLFMFSIISVNTPEFITWFFGAQYMPMSINMIIVNALILVNPLGGVISNQFALALGKDKAYAYPLIAGSLISLTGNLLLVPTFASLSASIILVVVETIVCILRFFFVRKDINLKKLFNRDIAVYCMITVICCIVGILLPNLLSNHFFNMSYKSIVITGLFIVGLMLSRTELANELRILIKKVVK